MIRKLIVILAISIVGLIVFLIYERFKSNAATRVHNALRNGAFMLRWTGEKEYHIRLRPNWWPNGCGKDAAYAVGIVPSDSVKGTEAEIQVYCGSGSNYTAKTPLKVLRLFKVDKAPEDAITIRLGRHGDSAEVIGLE